MRKVVAYWLTIVLALSLGLLPSLSGPEHRERAIERAAVETNSSQDYLDGQPYIHAAARGQRVRGGLKGIA